MAPTWSDLSTRAREALDGLTTLRAWVYVVEPAQGFSGDTRRRELEVRWAYPDLWRIDDDSGTALVRDGRRHIERDEDNTMQPLDWVPGYRPDTILGLGWGHPELFLEPDEFRTPVSGPEAVETAGRAAWSVRLAAPGNKPYVLIELIDDLTGLPLGHHAEGTPYQVHVQHLRVDEPLPDDTFSWDGPVPTTARQAPRGAR